MSDNQNWINTGELMKDALSSFLRTFMTALRTDIIHLDRL